MQGAESALGSGKGGKWEICLLSARPIPSHLFRFFHSAVIVPSSVPDAGPSLSRQTWLSGESSETRKKNIKQMFTQIQNVSCGKGQEGKEESAIRRDQTSLLSS